MERTAVAAVPDEQISSETARNPGQREGINYRDITKTGNHRYRPLFKLDYFP